MIGWRRLGWDLHTWHRVLVTGCDGGGIYHLDVSIRECISRFNVK
jgi:hypothetical protein